MLSIHTNLSSLIAQSSLTKSTNELNKAIERMSTGYKINHAGDNAANYSIATDYSSKIGSYEVAYDNTMSGLDLVTTAQDTISLMQEHGSRIHALITQAQNGTYGADSLNAINTEVAARIMEIDRIYRSTQFNGIDLFQGPPAIQLPSWTDDVKETAATTAGSGAALITTQYNGFINNPVTYSDSEVAAMTSVSEVDGSYSSGVKYKISSAEELAKLATDVNSGVSHTGAIFVLANNIDLAAYCAEHEAEGGWTAIGITSNEFNGTFDGNGHKISNLTINKPSDDFQGLFGLGDSNSSTIKNVGVENCNINARGEVGGIAGEAGYVINCYAKGNVTGNGNTGLLAGYVRIKTDKCYAEGSVTGLGYTGGLIGCSYGGLTNSFAKCTVSGTDYVGGLTGWEWSGIGSCYATGDVTGTGNYVGGLVGWINDINKTVSGCYATGDVRGNDWVGGLIGRACIVSGCYATGEVRGHDRVGGLVGYSTSDIGHSYATGNVISSTSASGLGGSGGRIIKCYATGNVTGNSSASGLTETASQIQNSYATGNVSSNGISGGLIADARNITITSCFATGDVSGTNFVGGAIGRIYQYSGTTNINGLCSSGTVTGDDKIGNLIGGIVDTSNGSSFGTVNISNASVMPREGLDIIGFEGKNDGTAYESGQMEGWLANTRVLTSGATRTADISLQVGINSDSSSRIVFNSSFDYDLSAITSGGAQSAGAYSVINTFLDTLSTQATMLGAVQNRLESAIESLTVDMNNAVSALSTIKDADMAQESSNYIRQQILQNAASTLLATANQTPAIALQLI